MWWMKVHGRGTTGPYGLDRYWIEEPTDVQMDPDSGVLSIVVAPREATEHRPAVAQTMVFYARDQWTRVSVGEKAPA